MEAVNSPPTTLRVPIGEEMNMLLDLDRRLTFVRDLLPHMGSDSPRRAELAALLGSIERRAGDKELRLALVGHFNAGKSTFLNALMRQRVLKTALRATTAVPTFLRYGQKRSMVLHLKDGRALGYDEHNLEQMSAQVSQWTGREPVQGFEALLQAVTADNAVASQVDHVEAFLPGRILREDICLIDTPGDNPGEEQAGGHREITRRIVREAADAVIAIFPAVRVYTSDFHEFLSENAAGFLHRSAFVITMMDVVEPEDRTDIVNYVRGQLRTRFALEDPLIVTCAAAMMFGASDGARVIEAQWFQKQFEHMEEQLVRFAIGQRALVISEQIIALMRALLEGMDAEVAEQHSQAQQESLRIEQNSIQSIDDMIARLRRPMERGYLDNVATIKRKLAETNAAYEAALIKMVGEQMATAQPDTVEGILGGLSAQIMVFQEAYVNHIKALLGEMAAGGQRAIAGFQTEFERFYRGLRALDVIRGSVCPPLALPDVQMTSFQGYMEKIETQSADSKKVNNYSIGGGAAVGFAIFGPLGALVGAGVGALLGKGLANNAWEKLREEMVASTTKDVVHFAQMCAVEHLHTVAAATRLIWESVERTIQAHRQTYQETIQRKILSQRYQLEQLARRQEDLADIRRKIAAMTAELEQAGARIRHTAQWTPFEEKKGSEQHV